MAEQQIQTRPQPKTWFGYLHHYSLGPFDVWAGLPPVHVGIDNGNLKIAIADKVVFQTASPLLLAVARPFLRAWRLVRALSMADLLHFVLDFVVIVIGRIWLLYQLALTFTAMTCMQLLAIPYTFVHTFFVLKFFMWRFLHHAGRIILMPLGDRVPFYVSAMVDWLGDFQDVRNV